MAYSVVIFVPSFVNIFTLDRQLGLGGSGGYTKLFVLNVEVFTSLKTHTGA